METLLKPIELAQRWQLKLSTLESWRVRGGGANIPFVKIGGAVRYRLSDVERVEAENLRDREVTA